MAFFRPYFSDKMQSHKYSSCHSLITSEKQRMQAGCRQITVLWQHFFFPSPNFISVLSSLHRKKREKEKEKKKRKKRTSNFVLCVFSHMQAVVRATSPAKGQSRFSDATPCRTRAYAKQQHTFLWEQIFCFGEVPVATPNPILSNTHTHTIHRKFETKK